MNNEQDESQRLSEAFTESLQQFLSLSPAEQSGLNEERINALLETLSTISEKELEELGHKDSTCSICMQSFLAILAEGETASVMESPALYSGELGVTRLNQPWQCGHLFCRRDITKWIKTGKPTCPMCRKSLIEPGSQPETQESTPQLPGHNQFALDVIMGLDHMFSDRTDAHFARAFDQRSRDDDGDDHSRNEYSGMYS
ncbi:hypothetical protein P691DRAFT_723419 [Macrolepiota fuliginosa MF-IS2]|uniref:RING-type domain-containing protein n=1 Tax=Macrolepiota fuliginosa MF-IS2 TaxID=1400762 RepID=A0A9P5XHW2_9AGAR|nr:hypothetical protein P691DRAFT_723419 [Macrolepiota fuliginosa MF-IS2]